MICDNCENFKPKPAPDAVSGLVPRFTPKTELPKGAVLVTLQECENADIYWTPDGKGVTVRANGTWSRIPALHNSVPAARALALPLAGEDLAEGEEFYRPSEKLSLSIYEGCRVHIHGGTDDDERVMLRRWDKGKVHGWICRKLDAKPAPVELGEWRGWKLTWQKDSPGEVVAEKGSSWDSWKPGKRLSPATFPELVNALLTAYRRAVDKRLATWPTGWEWVNCFWPQEDDGSPRPENSYHESRRRAALLGLCENVKEQPADDVKKPRIISGGMMLCPNGCMGNDAKWRLYADGRQVCPYCGYGCDENPKHQLAVRDAEVERLNEQLAKAQGDAGDAMMERDQLKREIAEKIDLIVTAQAGLNQRRNMNPDSFDIWCEAWLNYTTATLARNRGPR